MLQNCDGGNVQSIVQTAKTAGLQSLIIKAHDGTVAWSQYTQSLVDELHAAGLLVGAWGYCYGQEPQVEAERAIAALDMGADFYVADVEEQFDMGSMWGAAETLMSAIKSGAKGKPVGYTSFALPAKHPGFPFTIFSKYSDFTFPQVYWNDLQLPPATAAQTAIAYYSKYGVPIIPIGQSYGPVTPTQIQQFIAACSGLSGYSWWDYQHATTAMWSAISSGKVQSGTTILQRGSTGDAVKKLQEELNEILGANIAEDGVYGPQTEAEVRVFQQLYHLQVDGIAGPQTLEEIQKVLASRYPSINVEIDGAKQLPGIAVNNVTYVNWGALEVAKVPYQYKGNGLFVINGKDVQGVIQDNVTYLPWNIALPGYTPVKIDGGWNFVKQQPTPNPQPTPQPQPNPQPSPQTPTDAQIAAQVESLLQQAQNLLKGVK